MAVRKNLGCGLMKAQGGVPEQSPGIFHALERQEQFPRLGLFGGLNLNSQLSVGNLKIINYCNEERHGYL